MKLFGKPVEPRGIEIVVIPRKSGDLVFKLKPVDLSNFEDILPEPKNLTRVYNDGTTKSITNEEAYANWAEKKSSYMILQSLSATEYLTWDTVDLNNPETWGNYRKEMIDDGFSEMELSKILEGIITACGLSSDKIEEARKSFLASKAEQNI